MRMNLGYVCTDNLTAPAMPGDPGMDNGGPVSVHIGGDLHVCESFRMAVAYDESILRLVAECGIALGVDHVQQNLQVVCAACCTDKVATLLEGVGKLLGVEHQLSPNLIILVGPVATQVPNVSPLVTPVLRDIRPSAAFAEIASCRCKCIEESSTEVGQ